MAASHSFSPLDGGTVRVDISTGRCGQCRVWRHIELGPRGFRFDVDTEPCPCIDPLLDPLEFPDVRPSARSVGSGPSGSGTSASRTPADHAPVGARMDDPLSRYLVTSLSEVLVWVAAQLDRFRPVTPRSSAWGVGEMAQSFGIAEVVAGVFGEVAAGVVALPLVRPAPNCATMLRLASTGLWSMAGNEILASPALEALELDLATRLAPGQPLAAVEIIGTAARRLIDQWRGELDPLTPLWQLLDDRSVHYGLLRET